MRLVGATFVDHQATIQYPVRYILNDAHRRRLCEHYYLLGADAENVGILRAIAASIDAPTTVLESGVKILNAVDISRSMNAAVDLVRAREPDAFILLMHADTLATDELVPLLRDFCTPAYRGEAVHTHVRNGKLFHDTGGGWGHTVVGPTNGDLFNHDGTFLHGENRPFLDEYLPIPTTLSLGYLSSDIVMRHLIRHFVSYNNQTYGAHLTQLYDRSPDEFAAQILRDCGITFGTGKRLSDVDPRYEKVHADFGLLDEERRFLKFMGTTR